MFPVDNLYVLDVANNENTQKILDYFDANVQKYNGLAKRKLRVFRITETMLQADDMIKALEQKGVKLLPSLQIFQPVQEVFSGVDEIIAFVETLFRAIIMKQQSQKRVREEESNPLMDDTNKLYTDFYKNEIIGRENEEDAGANMASQISDRYRSVMQRRNPKGRTAGGPGQEYDEGMEDAPPPQAFASRSGGDKIDKPPPLTEAEMAEDTKDNVMSSVNKVCGGDADGELERAFYENLQPSTF